MASCLRSSHAADGEGIRPQRVRKRVRVMIWDIRPAIMILTPVLELSLSPAVAAMPPPITCRTRASVSRATNTYLQKLGPRLG